MTKTVTVIGGGLAGCEAAWQLARHGVQVRLYEMKPHKRTPAHHSDMLAELVCSNSLRADSVENAVGLLKEEMRRFGSLIIKCADETRVPAGGSLAVDRHGFSKLITENIKANPLITLIEQELTELPEGNVIVASGPLTSDSLAEHIKELLGGQQLHFFDAAAPLIAHDSIDMESAYFAARYGKGDADYLNCPMDKPEYIALVEALRTAKEAELHGFDDKAVFEGCLPVEVMARRGENTLRFGPLKPIGLRDPRTGKGAYAVAQLRRDNAAGDVFNLVGFQTHLTFPEQKRVFGLIPALKNADFLRYGVMHRNTYIDSPRLLNPRFELKSNPRISFAGQMTGVEGYVESAASGLMAGIHTARRLLGLAEVEFPPVTAHGALCRYISNPSVLNFQPMNVNFGIFPAIDDPAVPKKEKKAAYASRALSALPSYEVR